MGYEKHLLTIDGSIYDVSGFAHPGGLSLLQDAEGFDVSDNFHSYHLRDIDISKYPSIRKVGTDPAVNKTKYKDLTELKQTVRRALHQSPYHPMQQHLLTTSRLID
jgi:cytochrome b involved in lipid metabolism